MLHLVYSILPILPILPTLLHRAASERLILLLWIDTTTPTALGLVSRRFSASMCTRNPRAQPGVTAHRASCSRNVRTTFRNLGPSAWPLPAAKEGAFRFHPLTTLRSSVMSLVLWSYLACFMIFLTNNAVRSSDLPLSAREVCEVRLGEQSAFSRLRVSVKLNFQCTSCVTSSVTLQQLYPNAHPRSVKQPRDVSMLIDLI
jgi:hypothetical protein